MATPVIMPKLEMSQETATVVEWLKQEGEAVEKGEPILLVETDKATIEIEAPDSGVLAGIGAAPNQEVPVTEVIAHILQPGEEAPQKPAAGPSTSSALAGEGSEEEAGRPSKAAGTPAVKATPVAQRMAAERGLDLGSIGGSGPGGQITKADVEAAVRATEADAGEPDGKVRATPAARRLAREKGVDLSALHGSGPRGRVQEDDVRSFTPRPAETVEAAVEVIPLKGVRGIIKERMAASARAVARVTLVTEVDATAFVEAKEKLEAGVADEWGFAPGINDLLGVIVARALRELPYMNARLSDDGEAIERLSAIHLGMAVDTERGLLVPVIRDADRKGLRAFGAEFRTLVKRAQAGRSSPEDLAGGTFTITNLGMYGIDAFTPIINLPETAILGVGRIHRKPAEHQGEIALRWMWTLSLVFDHRLVDGAPASRFLQRIGQIIETPYLLLE